MIYFQIKSWEYAGTRCGVGEALLLPPPDNDNLELMPGCPLTPAEVMQWLRRERRRLSRAVAMDTRLWTCPEHRRDWIVTLGLEKLTLWHCYGVWGA
jgi:hypothetical protein